MPGAFSIDQLVAAVRAGGASVGTATVYRAVAAMVESGHLEQVGTQGGRALYLRCGEREHHHHLICTGCGSATKAPCPLGSDELGATAGAGFVVTRHEMTIYGLCPECLGAPSACGKA